MKQYAALAGNPVVNIGGKSYDAGQILDKTLIARKKVPVYRINDLRKSVGYISAGAPIGVVYAWIGPVSQPGHIDTRGKLFWQFYDASQGTYYVEHESNAFDASALKQQGAITTWEQVEAEKDKEPQSWQQTLTNIATTGILVFAGVILLKSAIPGGNRRGRILYV